MQAVQTNSGNNAPSSKRGQQSRAPQPQGQQPKEQLPSSGEVRTELTRERRQASARASLRRTVFAIVVAAVAAIITIVLLFPILRLYGNAMEPTLQAGDIVISTRTSDFRQGDVMAFYYNNNVLVKRVIAQSGDWVRIDDDGTVYVNDQPLDEPYLDSKALGNDVTIDMPYQVPQGKVFVLGDNREESIDSRDAAVGCVSQEQILGKVVFRVWPLLRLGPVG